MKAIRVHEFGSPDVLKLEELEDLKPDEAQVLVKIMAVGVNPVEAYVRSGGYARKPGLPYTPGTDAAGKCRLRTRRRRISRSWSRARMER